MRAPEVGGGARSRRRLQLHHGFTANKTGVPASGGLSTLVPGALGPQRSRRSSRRPVPAGRSRPPEAAILHRPRARGPHPRIGARNCQSIGPTAGYLRKYLCTLSLSLWELLRAPRWTSRKPTAPVGPSRILEACRPCGTALPPPLKKCACLGPSRRRSPRRPALSIARANCSMTLVGGTDSRCERRRSCQCASTTKW